MPGREREVLTDIRVLKGGENETKRSDHSSSDQTPECKVLRLEYAILISHVPRHT